MAGRLQLRPQADGGYTKLFRFYGVNLARADQQLQGDCPFPDCQNPTNHFFAAPGTGLWDCKRCGRSGNAYGFIREFHSACLSGTSDDDYKTLAEVREGISDWNLKYHKFAYNHLLDEWLIPAYNLKGEITNLYAWKQKSTIEGPVMEVHSGPTFKQIAYGLQHYRREKKRPLWILEGHWDLLAFWEALQHANLEQEHDCIAVPGATTFPEEDITLLSMRDVRLCFDNDQAGEKGIVSVCQKLGRHCINPSILYRINWNHVAKGQKREKIKEGYDVRDEAIKVGSSNLIPSLTAKLSELKIDLSKAANENYDPTARMLVCTSFSDLCEEIAKPKGNLYLPPALQDTLAIIFSVAATTRLGGKPSWVFIIGPTSAGKTTLVELLSTASTHCFGISKMTGLLSGYFRQGMGDASLLPKLQDKCVIIKDFTTILSMSDQIRDNIFGELRDLYDGSISAFYRNHENRSFKDVRFHIIACVTDMIRKYNQTDAGERFLQVEFDSYWNEEGYMERDSVDRRELTGAAIQNLLSVISGNGSQNRNIEHQGLAWGFLDHLVERIKEDKTWVQSKTEKLVNNKEMLNYIDNLGNWTAFARAKVDRDKEKQIQFRTRVPYGQRIAESLVKQCIGVSLVLDEEPDSDRVRSIVRKLALDTGFSFVQEIMLAIAHSEAGMASCSQIAKFIGLGETAVLNRLRDMQELGMCEYHTSGLRLPGNQSHIFTLSQEVKEMALALGFMKEPQAYEALKTDGPKKPRSLGMRLT